MISQKLFCSDSGNSQSNVTASYAYKLWHATDPSYLQVLTYLHPPCQKRHSSIHILQETPDSYKCQMAKAMSGGKQSTNAQSICQIIWLYILITYRTNVLYRPINSIWLDDKASTTCTVCNLFYNF